MAPRPALRPFAVAGTVAAVVLSVWWFTAPRTAMPPVSPMGDQPVYTAADDVRLPLLEPVLHAPWIGGTAVGALLLPAVVLAAGAGVAVVAGASAPATLFVLLALVLDASFAAALAHQAGLVTAVGLVWLAAGGAFSEPRHPGPRPWLRSLVAIAVWALAVWWHWLALAAWPVVLAGLRRRPERRAWGLWTLISIVAGLAAFVAHFAWMAAAAERQAFAPGVSLSWWDALVVAFDSRPRMPAGSFAAPDVATRLPYLPAVLAAAGLAFGTSGRWWRRAVTLVGLLIVAVGLGWPAWQAEAARYGFWLLAPMAAAGLTWAVRQATPGRAALAMGLLGAILVGESFATSARPLAGQEARGFRDEFARELDRVVASTGAVVAVAEDTRLDSALAAWVSGRAGIVRAVQGGAVVAEALASGRTVLAGPTARRQLLLAGVEFAEGFTITDPAPYGMSVASAAFRCAAVRADRWSLLPGVEYTGRLGIEVPPRPGAEMHLIVGDALPLAVRVETPDGRFVPVAADPLLSGPGTAAPPADYWLESGAPEDSPRVATRLRLTAHPVRSTLLSVRLGRRAPRVLARLIGFAEAARGRVCAAPVGPRVFFGRGELHETVPLEAHDLYGRGWYGVEPGTQGPSRWTDDDPVLLLRSATRMAVDVELDAAAAADGADVNGAADGQGRAADDADGIADGQDAEPSGTALRGVTVTLRVNGIAVGTRPMVSASRRYTWKVPAGVWLDGTNELWWHVSRGVRPADVGGADTRELAMRVYAVAVRRQ